METNKESLNILENNPVLYEYAKLGAVNTVYRDYQNERNITKHKETCAKNRKNRKKQK